MAPESASPQADLVDRIHPLLADRGAVRVISMFGGRAFMLDDAMVVSAGRTGDLLVRVDRDQFEGLLERDGARQAEMSNGRRMGPGWISVDAEAITGDGALQQWVDIALAHHRATTCRKS